MFLFHYILPPSFHGIIYILIFYPLPDYWILQADLFEDVPKVMPCCLSQILHLILNLDLKFQNWVSRATMHLTEPEYFQSICIYVNPPFTLT